MNEKLLAYICEQKTAIIKLECQADLVELFDEGLVTVEQANGNFSVTATDAGHKWNAANGKAMVEIVPASETNYFREPVASDPTPVVWDEPTAFQHVAEKRHDVLETLAATPVEHSPPTAPAWAQQSPFGQPQEMPVWARPKLEAPVFNAEGQIPIPVGNGPQPEQSVGNTPAQNASQIEIVSLALPPIRRPRGRPSDDGINQWPFDKLEIGKAFYIPPSEAHPKPHKTRAGLVIAANKKYSEAVKNPDGSPALKARSYNKTVVDERGDIVYNPDGTKKTMEMHTMVPVTRQIRKFMIFDAARVEGQPYRVGAWVYRVPVEYEG